MSHGKKMRPVVTVEEKTGNIKVETEFVRGKKDEYGLTGNNLIDNYCNDEKGKMLIYMTKQAHKRYKVLNNLEVPVDNQGFEEYYKKIKNKKLKSKIEQE